MRNAICKLSVVVIVLLLISAVSAQSQLRTISIVYQPPKQHVPDFCLVDRLVESLTMQGGLRVIVPEEDSSLPASPNRRFEADQLLDWGREIGSRYIIYLRIDDRSIATRKRTSIPWILSRYVVEGRLRGIYSLIDLNRNKVVGSWELTTRLTGPRQWQVAADYSDDPDLQISAPGKVVFLEKLEKKSVEEIIATITPHLKGR